MAWRWLEKGTRLPDGNGTGELETKGMQVSFLKNTKPPKSRRQEHKS